MFVKNSILFLFIFLCSANAAVVFDKNDMSFKIGSSGGSSSNDSSSGYSNDSDSEYNNNRSSVSKSSKMPAYSDNQDDDEVDNIPVKSRHAEKEPSKQKRKVYFDDDDDIDVDQIAKDGNTNKQQKDVVVKTRPAEQSVADKQSFNDDQNYSQQQNDKPINVAPQKQKAITNYNNTEAEQDIKSQGNKNDIVFANPKKYDNDILVKKYQGVNVVPVPARKPVQHCYCEYLVKPADNLSIIGKHFNASSDEIAIAMGLEPKQKPEVGKIYRIPVMSYLVEENDTVDTIAAKKNVKAIELKIINNGTEDIRQGNVILLPIIDRSKIDLSKLQEKRTEVIAKSIFIWPIKNISSVKNEEDGGFILSSSNKKNETKAIAKGVVIYVGDKIKKYGNMIMIKHDNGYASAYGYVENVTVQKNDLVMAGQVIGTTSSSSLYFMLKKDREILNPLNYLSNAK